jgi:peptidoglycan/LPS O-acetylase OafA/YrhL
MTASVSGQAHVRGDVQGLRAIAVLVVVAFHAGLPIPGGFVGVDMFFVISGFVITLTLLRRYDRQGSIQLRDFFIRRFKRLFPALAVVVGSTLVLSAFVLFPIGPLENAGITGLAALFSIANVAIALTTGDYFDDSAELNPLLHTWSLAVEEQFYLVFPLILAVSLFVFRKGARPLRATATVIATLSLLSLLLVTLGPLTSTYLEKTLFLDFYSPIGRVWEFGAGVLTAMWSRQTRSDISAPGRIMLYAAGFGLLAYSLWGIAGESSFPGPTTALPVLATAALIMAGGSTHIGANPLLESKVMRWVGDRSYSIYLWHWPLLTLGFLQFERSALVATVAVLLTFVASDLSFRHIEQPFRAHTISTIPRAAGLAVKWASVPAALAVIFSVAPSQAWGTQFSDGVARPLGYEECHVNPKSDPTPHWCSFQGEGRGSTVEPTYLVGDSNAAHFSEGLKIGTEKSGRNLLVSTASTCPLVVGIEPVVNNGDSGGQCLAWQVNVMRDLAESQAGIVVLAWSDDVVVNPKSWLRTSENYYTSAVSEKAKLFEESLENTVRTLRNMGHDVILVQTVPHWADDYKWNLAECSLVDALSGCNRTMPLEWAQDRSKALSEPVIKLGLRLNVPTLDFGSQICPDGRCATWNGQAWTYRDGSHISRTTSRNLSDLWVAALNETSRTVETPN